MASPTEAYDWSGRTLVGSDGKAIGRLEALYADKAAGGPEWAAVKVGRRRNSLRLVPLAGARSHGEDVEVEVDLRQVESAPEVQPDGELSQADEERLYRHYGMDYSREASSTGLPTRQNGSES
jgi:hypothetical protein